MTALAVAAETFSGGSVCDLVDKRAQETPDSLFLIDPETGRHITYAQLRAQAANIAAGIENRGVSQGESVAYAAGNSSRAAVTILGIMYGGYLATAINLVAGADTIAYVLDHSEARLVLADAAGRSLVSAALAEKQAKVPFIDLEDHMSGAPVGTPAGRPEAGGDALLMYTSGTTGRPKGVVLTHANLIAGGRNAALSHRLMAQDRGMCVLPLYHINGLCVTMMGALVSGGSLVVPRKFSVSTFWPTVIERRCTWFSVVPTQISYLLHHEGGIPLPADLSRLRFGRSASAPLSPDVQEAFENRFGVPIIETMGLTETAAQILSNPLPPCIRKIGSPGVAHGNEVRIGDKDQNEMARGEEGEVLVRGPNVMRCYLKNEAATAEALTTDGWFRTGDLGRMDEDGYVTITGRLKELIIKGGENIAPREIDDALYSHPDIIEAAAFSRACDRYGETVEAAVMLRPGSAATEADLIGLCTARIGAFKSPDRVHLLPELPKGPSGKIQRIRLAELTR